MVQSHHMCPVRPGTTWTLPPSSMFEWICPLFNSLNIISPERFPWSRSSLKCRMPCYIACSESSFTIRLQDLRAWGLCVHSALNAAPMKGRISVVMDLFLDRIPIKLHSINTYPALFSKNLQSEKESTLNENSFQSLTFVFIAPHLNL